MIALVNPPFSNSSTYKFSYIRAKYPNPALTYLAGYLEKKNVDFKVIDAKFLNLNEEEIIIRLREISPEIIGITAITTEIADAQSFASKMRRCFPDSFIIIGGVHATALPTETLQANNDLDAVVVGEGEFALEKLSLAKDLHRDICGIPGLYYRDGQEIKHTCPQEYGKDLKDYSQAAFHLWPKGEKYFVSTYRGCPFDCSFCFRALGKRARLREPEHVLNDLTYIAEHAPDSELSICDSTFGLNRAHIENILKEMIKKGLNKKLKWDCTTRVDVVDEDFLNLIKEAGCTTISFGVESGSGRILKTTGKNITVEKSEEAVRKAKALGFKTVGYFIFGHIDETKAEARETLKLIYQLNTDEIAVGIMTPWPGTRVYELAQENKGGYYLLNKDYSRYDKYFGNVLKFQNFSLTYLDFLRIRAFVGLYFFNHRYLELLKFLYEHKQQMIKKLLQLARRLF